MSKVQEQHAHATSAVTDRHQALRAELDAVRAEYVAKIGDADAEYIRAVRTFARTSQVAGRLLIHFSLEPVGWGAGVLALATYKVLENMEIGHNVLHGQYDFMHDPAFSSATYELDMAATSSGWKRAHNATHHVYTNVIGRDHDFGYNLFRFSADVPWSWVHLTQPLVSPLSGLFFQYSIGAFDVGVLRRLQPRRPGSAGPKPRPRGEFAGDLWAFLRKAARQSFVDYALFPALAGPLALKVLAGNALSNALRNVWAYAVIYCGHLTEPTASFLEEDLAGEGRGGWYARQVSGSSNFTIGRLGHVLSGHLGFQIEHHLFPNIPAWRYPEMAPRVREICLRNGLPYHTGPLASQFASAMRRLVRFALPGGGEEVSPRRPPSAHRAGDRRLEVPGPSAAPQGGVPVTVP